MNTILQDWDIFKNTWSKKIDKTESYLFEDFDNFILNELQYYGGEKKNVVVKKICILSNSVRNILYKKNVLTLYIHASPFHIILDGIKYPSAFLLENFLFSVLRFIEKNNKIIKTIRLYNFNDNNLEEEEKEKEK